MAAFITLIFEKVVMCYRWSKNRRTFDDWNCVPVRNADVASTTCICRRNFKNQTTPYATRIRRRNHPRDGSFDYKRFRANLFRRVGENGGCRFPREQAVKFFATEKKTIGVPPRRVIYGNKLDMYGSLIKRRVNILFTRNVLSIAKMSGITILMRVVFLLWCG